MISDPRVQRGGEERQRVQGRTRAPKSTLNRRLPWIRGGSDAHSDLGRQYFLQGLLGLRPVIEMIQLARAEARKALELFPSEPTAHALLGVIAASHDYEFRDSAYLPHWVIAMSYFFQRKIAMALEPAEEAGENDESARDARRLKSLSTMLSGFRSHGVPHRRSRLIRTGRQIRAHFA
jgi:hypothetical protein